MSENLLFKKPSNSVVTLQLILCLGCPVSTVVEMVGLDYPNRDKRQGQVYGKKKVEVSSLRRVSPNQTDEDGKRSSDIYFL